MVEFDASKSRIFKDLVDYSKVPKPLVFNRCKYAPLELAFLWHGKKSVEDFYKDTDLYIYDLTKHQLIHENLNYISNMIKQIKELNLKKVLEYGGGIGEFSILCCENDIDITYYDIEGETKDYALWRFKTHGCDKIKIASGYPLNEKWDAVNIMDVLEHLENPEEVLLKLRDNVKYIFCPEDAPYNDFFPMHISKYDLSKYFIHVKDFLWKNKNLE